MITLRDKVAIIAGGGRGIGEAAAKLLAEAGAAVAVVDVKPHRAERVATAIEKAGHHAIPIEAELREPDDVARMIETTCDTLGGIDTLVNVAGGLHAFSRWTRMAEWSEEQWDDAMSRNLRYVFLTCRAAISVMLEQGRGGSIVNIASMSGQFSAPIHSGYGAAKAGVVNLTMSLAEEYGRNGIRVNAISPGSVLTPATRSVLTEERIAEYRTLVPMARVGQPEDIAGAVLFLVSDFASYVTGQTLKVDGGASIKFPLPVPGLD